MIEKFCLPLLEVRCLKDLENCLGRFTRSLGFEFFSASLGVDQLGGDTRFVSVHNTPDEFLSSFLSIEIGKKDPVMQHCKRSHLPIIWDQSTYHSSNRGELWEHQAAFGYQAGICVAMHLPNGTHFMFGVDRDKPLASDALSDGRVVAYFQLFATYAQQVSTELLAASGASKVPSQPVSDRELECLRWTMEGKTAWELGQILNIAEQTAARHCTMRLENSGALTSTRRFLRPCDLG